MQWDGLLKALFGQSRHGVSMPRRERIGATAPGGWVRA
ncbi:hypothetical protein LG3211_0173 [Lysobacter gummosus]|nr:hypothetical protein LG3211_0173 [Lysobacter gummosus]